MDIPDTGTDIWKVEYDFMSALKAVGDLKAQTGVFITLKNKGKNSRIDRIELIHVGNMSLNVSLNDDHQTLNIDYEIH